MQVDFAFGAVSVGGLRGCEQSGVECGQVCFL
jgi:hypothetical protein